MLQICEITPRWQQRCKKWPEKCEWRKEILETIKVYVEYNIGIYEMEKM